MENNSKKNAHDSSHAECIQETLLNNQKPQEISNMIANNSFLFQKVPQIFQEEQEQVIYPGVNISGQVSGLGQLDFLFGLPYLADFGNYNLPTFKSPFSQKIPLKTLKDEEYIYVNSKQYFRILRRREKRKKLSFIYNNTKEKNKKYHHESRHIHAMNRQRGKGGRFLSKDEKLLQESKSQENVNKEEEKENL